MFVTKIYLKTHYVSFLALNITTTCVQWGFPYLLCTLIRATSVFFHNLAAKETESCFLNGERFCGRWIHSVYHWRWLQMTVSYNCVFVWLFTSSSLLIALNGKRNRVMINSGVTTSRQLVLLDNLTHYSHMTQRLLLFEIEPGSTNCHKHPPQSCLLISKFHFQVYRLIDLISLAISWCSDMNSTVEDNPSYPCSNQIKN